MSIQGYTAPAAATPPPTAAVPMPAAATGEPPPPPAADRMAAGHGIDGERGPGGGELPVENLTRGGGGDGAPANSAGYTIDGDPPPAAESGGERRPTGATLSVPDAALKLNVPERTLRNWIAAGTLPVVRPDPVRGRRQMIRIPVAALEALLQDETFAGRPAAAGSGPAAASGGPSPDAAALAVVQARLEGAHTAARLHAQRRHEERERYEAERVEMRSELDFLRERMVRAEEAEREMRLLMAQQTQTLQQATRALQAFTERPALPEATPQREPAAPEPRSEPASKKIRWFWQRGG